MHSLLKRQIKKVFGNNFSPDENLENFIALIEQAYSNFDADRKLLERSLELSSKEMQEALDIANNATKIKSMFVANMSHEIRTPLNGVIGMLQLLQDTKLEVEQEEYIKVANTSATTLLSVINDILDFSKIEAGKLPIEEIDFNFADWFYSTIDMMNIHANNKEQELISHIESEIPQTITGDPYRLRQVLVNLISNAIKFTDKKGGILVIAKHRFDGEKTILEFSVADSGIGINSKNTKLFTPFEQEDTSISRKYGGTGLGLAIAKNIVEQMNGEISYTSKINVGSVFNFNVKVEVNNPDVYWYNVNSNFAKSIKDINILIVSDSNNKNNRYEEILNKWETNVTCCNSMDTAKSKIESENFELIILDLKNNDNKINELKKEINELKKSAPILCITPSYLTTLNTAINDLDCARTNSSTTLADLFDAILIILSKKDKVKTKIKKVILAEDNKVNQKLACIILEKSGYKVITANNGKEALSILEKEDDISLILMDVQMPLMDGFTATSTIRNCTKNYSKIPIIAMTAHASESDKKLCIKSGMNDFISKPFKKHELLILIEKYTKGEV